MRLITGGVEITWTKDKKAFAGALCLVTFVMMKQASMWFRSIKNGQTL
jgi:hypothetical protein